MHIMNELSVSGYISYYIFISKINVEIFNINLKMCPSSDYSPLPPTFIIQNIFLNILKPRKVKGASLK